MIIKKHVANLIVLSVLISSSNILSMQKIIENCGDQKELEKKVLKSCLKKAGTKDDNEKTKKKVRFEKICRKREELLDLDKFDSGLLRKFFPCFFPLIKYKEIEKFTMSMKKKLKEQCDSCILKTEDQECEINLENFKNKLFSIFEKKLEVVVGKDMRWRFRKRFAVAGSLVISAIALLCVYLNINPIFFPFGVIFYCIFSFDSLDEFFRYKGYAISPAGNLRKELIGQYNIHEYGMLFQSIIFNLIGCMMSSVAFHQLFKAFNDSSSNRFRKREFNKLIKAIYGKDD